LLSSAVGMGPRSLSMARASRRGESLARRDRVERWNRLADVQARRARHEHVRARGWRRIPHLLDVRARAGRPLGHVPVARPRATRSQRDRLLVAPPRRLRQRVTRAEGCATDLPGRDRGKPWTCKGRGRLRVDLSDRTTVVIGASRGLGRGIAGVRAGGSHPGRRRQFCDASAPVADVGDVLCRLAYRRQDRVHLAA
jgi:hypothetical protein